MPSFPSAPKAKPPTKIRVAGYNKARPPTKIKVAGRHRSTREKFASQKNPSLAPRRHRYAGNNITKPCSKCGKSSGAAIHAW